MTEAEITKQIREYLTQRGIFHFKVFQSGRGMGRAKRGVSDILACYKGRFVAIEVKGRNGKASDDQIKFLNDVNSAAGVAFIAKSVEDVEFWLNLKDWQDWHGTAQNT